MRIESYQSHGPVSRNHQLGARLHVPAGRHSNSSQTKFKLGRDLHDAGPGSSVRPCTAAMSSFSRETKFTHNLSARRSPQLVPVNRPQDGVGSRCPPARAVVRAANATKHEPGLSPSYRVVSYGSALEAWALPMRLLLHLITSVHSAKYLFAVVPLWRAAWIRWPSVVKCAACNKALFFAVLNGTSISDPEPVNFSCDPEELGLRTSHSRVNRTRKYLRSHQLPFSRPQLYRCFQLASRTHVADDLSCPEDPTTRLVTTPHSLL